MKKIILLTLFILICFALCACQKGGTNGDNPSNTINPSNPSNKSNQSASSKQEKIVINDDAEKKAIANEKRMIETLMIIEKNPNSRKEGSRYIKKIDDNHFGVYYFNEKEIDGYDYFVRYESNEEAELAKAAYDDPKQTIENIFVRDSMLIVMYSHAEYEGTTLESVEELIKD